MDNQNKRRKQAVYNLLNGTGTAIFILGALFKIMHWPGSSVGLIIGGVLLVLANVSRFFVGAEKENEDDTDDYRKTNEEPLRDEQGFIRLHTESETKRPNKELKRKIELVRLLAIMLVVAGALFKVLHAPYSTELLVSGVVLALLSYIVGEFILRKTGK